MRGCCSGVIHIKEKKRFEVRIGDDIVELDYRLDEGVISFTHTGVPRVLEGRGIGSQIVRAGLDYAREQGYKVLPLCSFVGAYIQRHDEYADLLVSEV